VRTAREFSGGEFRSPVAEMAMLPSSNQRVTSDYAMMVAIVLAEKSQSLDVRPVLTNSGSETVYSRDRKRRE